MTDSDEVLWCYKCNKRETHEIAGQKGICLKCGIEALDLPAARQKTINDCFIEFLTVSNGVDR